MYAINRIIWLFHENHAFLLIVIQADKLQELHSGSAFLKEKINI
jgi:hypothetical protein